MDYVVCDRRVFLREYSVCEAEFLACDFRDYRDLSVADGDTYFEGLAAEEAGEGGELGETYGGCKRLFSGSILTVDRTGVVYKQGLVFLACAGWCEGVLGETFDIERMGKGIGSRLADTPLAPR